jgi:hypothetical protein
MNENEPVTGEMHDGRACSQQESKPPLPAFDNDLWELLGSQHNTLYTDCKWQPQKESQYVLPQIAKVPINFTDPHHQSKSPAAPVCHDCHCSPFFPPEQRVHGGIVQQNNEFAAT